MVPVPGIWGLSGRAPSPWAETHLRTRRESGQTCLEVMQDRGHVLASRLARGRARRVSPSGGALRASGARGLPPPLSQGPGTEPGVGTTVEGGSWTGQAGRARLRPSGQPGPARGQPPARAHSPSAAGAAGACKRGQVPSPAPVSHCGRRRYRVKSAQQGRQTPGPRTLAARV